MAGYGGSSNGTGVWALGGANGGYPIVAQSPATAPVAQMRAQIRMVPVDLGGQDPNGASIPGEPGDLLAISGFGIGGGASLWFNVAGGTKGWTQVQGGLVGV